MPEDDKGLLQLEWGVFQYVETEVVEGTHSIGPTLGRVPWSRSSPSPLWERPLLCTCVIACGVPVHVLNLSIMQLLC